MRGRHEAITGLATALERGRRRPVHPGAGGIEGRHTSAVHPVGEGGALRPDAAVHDADHHVLAIDRDATNVLGPQTARGRQAQELGGRDGVELARLVFKHVHHRGIAAQGQRLFLRQPGREAVEHGVVGGDHGSIAHQRDHIALLLAQVGEVVLHGGRAVLEAAACGRLGRFQTGQGALVGGGRLILELDDIGLAVLREGACGQT
mmetsp:Transcript_17033/g.40642  ORF Transcript_17033/g.40642 Transcript_17033/m.40642 type:complete len:205 (+) Transcript_17033:149-763(+)